MEQKFLERYAKLLVSALNGHNGPEEGDVVMLRVVENAKPLLLELRKEVLRQGCHPLTNYIPQNYKRVFYKNANDDQLTYFPRNYLRGKVDEIDHTIEVRSEVNKYELEDVAPQKIMKRVEAMKPYRKMLEQKENMGKYSWTLAYYPSEHMASEVGMSLEEYEQEIIEACFLDKENPVEHWNDVTNEIERIKKKLDALAIEKVHVDSEDIDLTVRIGEGRKWLGASGRNVPSFEIFISPDWRGTEGHIRFDQPLFRYGNIVKDIYLEFENGIVTEARASEGEEVLKEMIRTEGANKVGEFSLTDSRFSRLTEFMGITLYDENVGGEYGNTHIALGNAYKDSYPGNPSKVSDEEWNDLGYNESSVHTDMISTKDRTVTAYLKDGEEKILFEDGEFKL